MLDDFWRRTWASLASGAAPGRSPFTVMQLASVGLDGGPKLRGVILRHTDEHHATVQFHTDLRSPKVAELRHLPKAAMTGWDADSNLQIRLEGDAFIHPDGAEKRAAWHAARLQSRLLYTAPLRPGSAVGSPDSAQPLDDTAGPDALALAYTHFAVVSVVLTRVEMLQINSDGHFRARFEKTPTGWGGSWIAP